jgi:hypothetical protein
MAGMDSSIKTMRMSLCFIVIPFEC